MAVYDGFFDAVQDEATGQYDRAYNAENVTDYFSHIIGSGVCIHNAPNSFKVRFDNGNAVVSPGYLFIQGYWLKNDADYSIPVTGSSTLAVVAHLNLGQRMIELETAPVSQAYPDSLVLALVNPAAGTAEDTRYNTDICGVIDTAGELSSKVEWAVNYIDNEIESKLAAAEADIAAQSQLLDAKIAEVQAQVDKITSPPVGSIKFSAAQDVGPEWLQCNGDFVSESQYPELVAALGKLTPSNDKFQLISSGEIAPQITNGVVYGGKLWVYSYSAKKLYGVDLESTAAIKEIPVTSEDAHFGNFLQPTNAKPIALSIVPHKTGTGAKLFLGQYLTNGANSVNDTEDYGWMKHFLLFQAEFTGADNSISMYPAFTKIEKNSAALSLSLSNVVPYVISKSDSGVERYFTPGIQHTNVNGAYYPISWVSGENAKDYGDVNSLFYGISQGETNSRYAFSHKNKGELVTVTRLFSSGGTKGYSIGSILDGTFNFSGNFAYGADADYSARTSILPLNVVGDRGIITEFTATNLQVFFSNKVSMKNISTGIPLPSAARVFVDAGAYLWGKDIYMIFVGTGIIFSRTLEEGDFGYLDTTSVLGTITQFGYLDYSKDEGTLYLLGQDTTNTVKAAKIVLNTLYDYANDGAWLPTLAADGVPAYIKAKETEAAT